MSINTLKKKSATIYGTKQSGKPPGGQWISQGPFGSSPSLPIYSSNGFSLNGGTRSTSVGSISAINNGGTRYRGAHPIGYGGLRGRYVRAQPSFNAGEATVEVCGNQHAFIKPSVIDTRGMLRQRYKWAYSGQYPNYWVQPIYPFGYLHENKSQGMYIRQKRICNTVPTDTQTYGPVSFEQYIDHIQRPCTVQTPEQKPFPYATNGAASCDANPVLRLNEST